jgi:hypothetical protein
MTSRSPRPGSGTIPDRPGTPSDSADHTKGPWGMGWGIKKSFQSYLAGLGDGNCAVTAPASHSDGTFFFPADQETPGRYLGTVTFTGHHGLLHVIIGEPAISTQGTHGRLTITDPDWPDRRMTLAHFSVKPAADNATGSWQAVDVALTADGSDLFFRVYDEGAHLDDFTVDERPVHPTTAHSHPEEPS